MLICEEDTYDGFCRICKDLGYFRKSFSRYDNFLKTIAACKFNSSNRDSVSVKRYHLEHIAVYFEELTTHYLVGIIVRY